MKELSAADRLAYLVATGAGAGLAPVAPGTCGAVEAVLVFLAMTALVAGRDERLLVVVVLNVAALALGIWASGRACRVLEVEDPSQIVVDEISGQLIALAPLAVAPSAVGVILAFLLFRLFDIFKPYPIGKLERLPGGVGVMMDDVLAGAYAAVLVWLCMLFRVI